MSEVILDQLWGTATILLLPEGRDLAASSAEVTMTPPFTSRRLLYRVRKLAESLPRRDIRVGDLLLDPDTGVLHKGEAEERLLPKETALLALFMRNRGRVLSRQEIMEKVWDTDYLEDTRTLTVHVRWLRLKIEDDASAPRYLQTVRGVDYRFDVPQPDADLAEGKNVV